MARIPDAGPVDGTDTIAEAQGPRRVSVLDLTTQQLIQLESEEKLNLARWKRESPSLGRIMAKVGSVVTGEPLEVWLNMSLRELLERVDLEGDDDPNPSRPSKPNGSPA